MALLSTLYNEFDPFAAAWLHSLSAAGHISEGEINEASIVDIAGADCKPISHFFAGIGGWDYALRLAGWPSDRPVWTGSCPCQPFSGAGKRKGTADARHLWPEFLRLIAECRPPTIFGEQVASKDGRNWLAGVRADLEALGYAVGAADLCAAGVFAPHIRQRLYWVAYAKDANGRPGIGGAETGAWENGIGGERSSSGGAVGGLDDTKSTRRSFFNTENDRTADVSVNTPTNSGYSRSGSGGRQGAVGLEHAEGQRWEQRRSESGGRRLERGRGASWSRYELAQCRDGKTHRFEPESFPLAYGLPGRVGRLRGYGNAIVPPLAAEFVMAFMEVMGIERERS